MEDALGFGAAKTDTAYTGLEAAVDVVTEIKAKLVAAREPGVDKEKINKELTEVKAQLASISESASFSGGNWL
ncbi:Flagellin [compost metagenome]